MSLYALLKLMSSNRLPFHALYPSTLWKAETRDGAGGDVRAGVRLHWPVCAPSWNLLPSGISGLLTLVLMTVPTFAESLSPCPFAVVRVASCAVSLPGSPMMTLILSRVAGVETGVFEAPLVHDSRNGGDILVDGSAGLGGADLAVMVGSVGLIVDLHVVGAFEVRIVGIAGLRAVPGEFRLVETLGQLVSLSGSKYEPSFWLIYQNFPSLAGVSL